MGAEAGNLEDEDAVVVEEVVHLAKERLVTTDSDVLHDTISNEENQHRIHILLPFLS